MSEASQIETLERQIINWTNRTIIAESESKRLLGDNHELWELIKKLVEINKQLAWKVTEGMDE